MWTTFDVRQEIWHPNLTLWIFSIKLDLIVQLLSNTLQLWLLILRQVLVLSWYTGISMGGYLILAWTRKSFRYLGHQKANMDLSLNKSFLSV